MAADDHLLVKVSLGFNTEKAVQFVFILTYNAEARTQQSIYECVSPSWSRWFSQDPETHEYTKKKKKKKRKEKPTAFPRPLVLVYVPQER